MGPRIGVARATVNYGAGEPKVHFEVTQPLNYEFEVAFDFAGTQWRDEPTAEELENDEAEDDEPSVYVGILQWIKKFQREYHYSDGTVIEVYLQHGNLPVRDGEPPWSPQHDLIFVQKPKREPVGAVLELTPESPKGIVRLTDVPESTAWYRLQKAMPQVQKDAELTRIIMGEEFLTSIGWSSDGIEIEEFIHWIEWKLDFDVTVYNKGNGIEAKVLKSHVMPGNAGPGEPPVPLTIGGPVAYERWGQRIKPGTGIPTPARKISQ